MNFNSLGEFVRYLESIGELRRIKADVDPYLEVTEIAVRAMREQKPALLFENVRGSRYPLAINVYASARRLEHALGQPPGEIGRNLLRFAEGMMPPTLSSLWHRRSMLGRVALARGRSVAVASSQR